MVAHQMSSLFWMKLVLQQPLFLSAQSRKTTTIQMRTFSKRFALATLICFAPKPLKNAEELAC